MMMYFLCRLMTSRFGVPDFNESHFDDAGAEPVPMEWPAAIRPDGFALADLESRAIDLLPPIVIDLLPTPAMALVLLLGALAVSADAKLLLMLAAVYLVLEFLVAIGFAPRPDPWVYGFMLLALLFSILEMMISLIFGVQAGANIISGFTTSIVTLISWRLPVAALKLLIGLFNSGKGRNRG